MTSFRPLYAIQVAPDAYVPSGAGVETRDKPKLWYSYAAVKAALDRLPSTAGFIRDATRFSPRIVVFRLTGPEAPLRELMP